MVFRALILFLTIPAFAKDLTEGRQALQRGDLSQALRAYQGIGPGDVQWSDKLEDLLRYHLGRGEGLEAWRLLQLGRRTHAERTAWTDYERLAVFRAEACPLAFPAVDSARGHLLNAAVYRFMPWLFVNGDTALNQDEMGSGHLAPGLVPYLAEIPKTELMRGAGCRLAKLQVRTREAVTRAELRELLDYLQEPSNAQASARLLLVMRALELAELPEIKMEKVSVELRRLLPAAEQIPWSEFPDPEKQWLFTRTFKAKRFQDIAPAERPLAGTIARAALSADGASPLWLAAMDLGSLPATDRREVLSKAEKLGAFPGRAWALYELARVNDELGATSEALTVLRRLLVEREETLDDALEQAAVSLAARIFSEHRLDARTQGALEAALPPRLWNTLLQQSLLRAALSARVSEFARLQAMRQRLRVSSYGRAADEDLARAMAARQLAHFRRLLLGFKQGAGQELLRFARELAGLQMEGAETRSDLLPYTRELAARLQALTYPGAANAEEVSDLVQLLSSPGSDGERERGARSVRQGVVKAGVARWSRPDLRPVVLALQPPAVMPRRELFFVPGTAVGREWIFSSAKR